MVAGGALMPPHQETAAADPAPRSEGMTVTRRVVGAEGGFVATRIAGGAPGIGGNQVVIDHGNGEFSFYGHLQPGSVRVRVGQEVARGERIGAVGSSGNSTEPHLHFHVCNGPDPIMCAGIPVQWDRPFSPMPDLPRAAQSGDFMTRRD